VLLEQRLALVRPGWKLDEKIPSRLERQAAAVL